MAPPEEPSSDDVQLSQLEEGLTRQPPNRDILSSVGVEDIQTHTAEAETTGLLLNTVEPARSSSSIQQPLPMALTLPKNFAAVVPGIYRSSYPQSQDYAYLQGLNLKTIVTLVQKDLPEGFQAFMDGNGIKHRMFDMAGTKKATIPLGLMRSILEVVMDERNHPILVHCNHGKHRTGCVMGILRKFNGWETSAVLDEYHQYAQPKARETDVRYLTDFQLADLGHLAKKEVASIGMAPWVNHYLFLCLIAVVSLGIWIRTFYEMMPFPRAPTRKSRSEF
ncbi:hypothetical protein JX265_010944 [Neoarthrinium moseri]|uniref:diphosphoinositol-polyphosphate diphosphatase n=1 Tax=Neoarthrinium moseri TaxID=1658444 RepID=A0A9Q0AJU5_9PEZI|nr:hypothetical protein JX266_003172 [Neoarthrinium moseri]KAI1857914.1 hypothetical protein JX265_010944 [Neoarthrinium moseri]